MHRCSNCGYEHIKWFGLCPKCGEGIGEEVVSTASSNKGANGKPTSAWHDNSFDWNGGSVMQSVKRVDENEPIDEVVRKTQYDGLNAILSSSGGFVRAQVCLLGASPGVGKSTLCASIADKNTLYISSEENYRQINQRALRVNPSSGCSILCSTSIAEILQAIREWPGDLVIIDSLQGIEFGVGYATTARFAHEITKTVKDEGKVGIIISQVTRSGEITGMNATIHVVDTVLHLERSETTGNIIAMSSKNRYGEVGSVAVFQHQHNGFVEVDVDEKDGKDEIGTTLSDIRFGYKVMKICVESLVVPSANSYGVRNAVGYNYQRLGQLLGVMSYFGKFDLSSKDVYVAISSGLVVDDIGVELAIINSILSSMFKKVVCNQCYGSIQLNGAVRNGNVDGKPITHIVELISMYK